MRHLEEAIDTYIENGIVRHVAVRVGVGGEAPYTALRGVDEGTLFDMASCTKIMATTSLALIALDRKMLSIGDPVSSFYPNNKGITVKNLLTHTIGIGYKDLRQYGFSPESVAEGILSIPSDIPVGSDVRYSCPGYILLGKILERVFDMPLNLAFDKFVAEPLGLSDSSFLPEDRSRAVNANVDEAMRGYVNDYNCQFLGGVAGNAGLFSTLDDVTSYIGFLSRRGAPLISEETFSLAVKNHTEGMTDSRGLGFVYVDKKFA